MEGTVAGNNGFSHFYYTVSVLLPAIAVAVDQALWCKCVHPSRSAGTLDDRGATVILVFTGPVCNS